MIPSRIVRFGSVTMGLCVSSLLGAEPKSHVLFMGANLALERDKKLYAVEDVVGSALLIDHEGKLEKVPQSPEVSIRVKESLKLAERRVSVGKLVIERAYTPENDPFGKFVSAAGAWAGQAAQEELSNMKMQQVEYALAAATIGAGAEAAEALAQARANSAELKQAEQQFVQTLGNALGEVTNLGAHAGRYAADAAEGNFDAIRVGFEVRPEESLARPYFIVIAQFRERDSSPTTARKWVYAKSLGALEAGSARQVDLLQGGFPPGYLLENYSVHLYNEGEEMATSVSRRSVELTADEAFAFQVIEYIGAHKGASLPAKVATRKLTLEMRERIVPGQLSETYYVRVSKDGRVLEAFRDDAARRPLQDPQLESVLKSLRFMPALEAGKPVEQIAPLKLGPLSVI